MGALREKIASKLYGGRIQPDEVFVSDGAKCDIARLQVKGLGVGGWVGKVLEGERERERERERAREREREREKEGGYWARTFSFVWTTSSSTYPPTHSPTHPPTHPLQLMFGKNVVTAVQDPSYPVYVDTAVIMGQTGLINEKSRQFDGIVYMVRLLSSTTHPSTHPLLIA